MMEDKQKCTHIHTQSKCQTPKYTLNEAPVYETVSLTCKDKHTEGQHKPLH